MKKTTLETCTPVKKTPVKASFPYPGNYILKCIYQKNLKIYIRIHRLISAAQRLFYRSISEYCTASMTTNEFAFGGIVGSLGYLSLDVIFFFIRFFLLLNSLKIDGRESNE